MFIKRFVNKNVIQHKLNLSIDVFCFNASFKSTAPSLPIEMPLKKKSMSADSHFAFDSYFPYPLPEIESS